jgi:hypothetical protein
MMRLATVTALDLAAWMTGIEPEVQWSEVAIEVHVLAQGYELRCGEILSSTKPTPAELKDRKVAHVTEEPA